MTETRTAHRLIRMTGRDPHEEHRGATPLELLFDLTLVVAFGSAGNELAAGLAEGHTQAAVVGFAFASFVICWAWINYSWFASAYDTDDWSFRLLTMVQMAGVVVVALGLPELFASLITRSRLDNEVMVAGYVVMRLSMLALWGRVYAEDPARRDCARTYLVTIAVAQVGWCLLLLAQTTAYQTIALAVVPLAIEFLGPFVAERRYGGIPWHPQHLAERYGLLAIITLGEGVIGTVFAMSSYVHAAEFGWGGDAVLTLGAGVGLTFGMWWMYFAVPWAEVLRHRRRRLFVWSYGHIVLFSAIAASGATLHVAEYYLEGTYQIQEVGTVLSLAVPVGTFAVAIFLLYTLVLHVVDPLQLSLTAVTAAVLTAAVVLAARGTTVPVCLVVVAGALVLNVVGHEWLGHRRMGHHLERLRA